LAAARRSVSSNICSAEYSMSGARLMSSTTTRGARLITDTMIATSIVSAATAAVTSDTSCERPPAARTTAVCEVPPPAGI